MLYAVLDYDLAIHNDIINTIWDLMGLLERCPVPYCHRIKDRDVRRLACGQHAPITESEFGCGHRGHFAYAVLQGDNSLLAHVFPQHTREGAIGARVRLPPLPGSQR